MHMFALRFAKEIDTCDKAYDFPYFPKMVNATPERGFTPVCHLSCLVGIEMATAKKYY